MLRTQDAVLRTQGLALRTAVVSIATIIASAWLPSAAGQNMALPQAMPPCEAIVDMPMDMVCPQPIQVEAYPGYVTPYQAPAYQAPAYPAPAYQATPYQAAPYQAAGPAYYTPAQGGGAWQYQCLPEGLIYRPYLAGVKESRFSAVFGHEKDVGGFVDATLGGRVGLARYGTTDSVMPEGWQLDVEGAAFPRLNLEEDWDLESVDFRVGIPLTYGAGPWQTKFAVYHLSSHLGDEFIERNPGVARINYSRDVIVLGESLYLTDVWRVYGEAGWAFRSDGGSEPWEFQFGTEFSSPYSTGPAGSPFLAVNGHLRQEVDYGGSVTVQTGWQWRGSRNSHLLRLGVHYLNGASNQYEFFNEHEEQIGLGVWYDY